MTHDPRWILLLPKGWRIACTVLAVVPLPGLGTIIAGWKNPHSGLLWQGILQVALVLFGSFPLVVPGAVGFLWACWSAHRIHRDAVPPPKWSRPTRVPP